jgi:hypothetical protein
MVRAMVARADIPLHRVALVDFDWSDVDLIPELLKVPELEVRRVAGRSERDPGIRIAALCGVPHTLDLGELARDGLHVALVGRGSSRRARIHELLGEAGAEVRDPREYLAERQRPTEARREDRPELTTLAPDELSSLVDSAIPDLEPEPARSWLEVAPDLDDSAGLGRLLDHCVEESGASAALLRLRDPGRDLVLAAHGTVDSLLEALGELVFEHGVPEVIVRFDSGEIHRSAGAWRVQVGARPAALMVAGFDPATHARSWHEVAIGLSVAWADRAPARVSMPPAARVSAEAFRETIAAVIERNDRDGQPFVVHRLLLDTGPGLVETVCGDLARDAPPGEALCRVGRDVVLVLSPGPASTYSGILDRVRDAWDRWAPPDASDSGTWACERIELASREDAGLFRFVIEGWLRKI